MERKNLIQFIIAIVVFVAAVLVIQYLISPPEKDRLTQYSSTKTTQTTIQHESTDNQTVGGNEGDGATLTTMPQVVSNRNQMIVPVDEATVALQDKIIVENENNVFVFSNAGAVLSHAYFKHQAKLVSYYYKDGDIDSINDVGLAPIERKTTVNGENDDPYKDWALDPISVTFEMGYKDKITDLSKLKSILNPSQEAIPFHFERSMEDNGKHILRFYKDFKFQLYESSQLLRLTKKISIPKQGYSFEVSIEIQNLSEFPLFLENKNDLPIYFFINTGRSLGPREESAYSKSDQFSYSSGLTLYDKGKLLENVNPIVGFNWLAERSHYFVSAFSVKPSSNMESIFAQCMTSDYLRRAFKNYMRIGSSSLKFKKDETKSIDLLVYLGPARRAELSKFKIIKETQEVGANLDSLFSRNIDVVKDILYPFEIGIEWVLYGINSLAQNFGISIILIALLLKIVLYPITRMQTKSTRRMQELQPKIKAINEKFKNDAQARQKATMELYRKEKYNPLSGCLPLLLQMPFLFALWAVLPYLIDLKYANFLWIKDLSSPDTVAHVNLLLTQELNILPLIMTATSLIQSFLMPQTQMGFTPTSTGGSDQAKQQQTMMKFLPVLFLFIFYSMPSGLVLYWTTSNLLQMGQQLIVNLFTKKKDGALPDKQKVIDVKKVPK